MLVGYQMCVEGYDIYLLGGECGLGTGKFPTTVWKYDTIFGRWSACGGAGLGAGCRHFACAVVAPWCYLVGGYGRGRVPQERVRRYNLNTGEYEVLSGLRCPRNAAGLVTCDVERRRLLFVEPSGGPGGGPRLCVCDLAGMSQTYRRLPLHNLHQQRHTFDYSTIIYYDDHIYQFCSQCPGLWKWNYMREEDGEIIRIGGCESISELLMSKHQHELTRGSELCSKDMLCVSDHLLCVVVQDTRGDYVLVRYDLRHGHGHGGQRSLPTATAMESYAEYRDSCAQRDPYPRPGTRRPAEEESDTRETPTRKRKLLSARSHRIALALPAYCFIK